MGRIHVLSTEIFERWDESVGWGGMGRNKRRLGELKGDGSQCFAACRIVGSCFGGMG
jgi:hypothetical protein